MKRPDLVIQPHDWILGIWWADWPAVTNHVSGQWFAYAIRDWSASLYVSSWHFWTFYRPDADAAWFSTMVVWEKPAQVVVERAKLWLFNEVHERVFSHSGTALVGGNGCDLVRLMETNEIPLPKWLRILVIERKQATERRAA